MARQTKSRKRSRHRGASAKANADLETHIASLGLHTIGEYKTWCRSHGYTGALNKTWQERRKERAVAEQEKSAAAANVGLDLHIERLGLKDDRAYQAWCKKNRLSASLNKSEASRKRELALMDRLQGDAVLARTKLTTRKLQDTLQAIYDGDLAGEDLHQPALSRIEAIFSRLGDDDAREAYLSILLHVEQHADLLGTKPAIPALGPQEGNTFIDALGILASRYRQWHATIDDWRPETHNSRRQFSSLVRHLICLYDVPTFMDTVWFYGSDKGAEARQDWFLHVGNGGNIRKTTIPVQLTKKMAHLFLQAPGNYSVEEAFRWGLILGLGGEQTLVKAVNGTFLGRSFDQEIFWAKVIHFFVNNPMLDPDQIGPIVDYIRNQKFAPQEIALPGGGVRRDGPAQPNFSVKGRSADKLLREVEAWHNQLARESRLPNRTWAPSGLEGFQRDEDKGARWTIHEILNTREITQEGRGMGHCVASYANNCMKGNISVWSMQVQEPDEKPARVMTIAVLNRARRINQARGRFNALPSGKTPNGKRITEHKQQLYLRHSRKILHDWREQENLTMARRT
jgi:hypothetical protein